MVAEGIASGLPGIGLPLAMKVVERECYMEGTCILVPFRLKNTHFFCKVLGSRSIESKLSR